MRNGLKNTNMFIRLTSCFLIRYQHRLILFIECRFGVLRKLSIDFFEQVVLEAVLSPNSNIQEHFVTLYTKLVLRGNTLSFQ